MMIVGFKLKIRHLVAVVLFFFTQNLHGQQRTVTIGGSELKSDAVLYLISEGNQGLILPAIDNVNAFNPSTAGMVVYNRIDNRVYYWSGTQWVGVGGGTSGGGDSYTLRLQGENLELLINGGVQDQIALSGFEIINVGGDISGTIGNATVDALQGRNLPGNAPSANQILIFDGTQWSYVALPSGTFTGVTTDGTTVTGDGLNTALSVGTIGNAQISAVDYTKLTNVPPDAVEDADADPTNEIQNLTFDTGTNTLSLTEPGQPDQTVDLSSLSGGGTDQTLSLTGSNLTISGTGGNTVDLSGLDTDTQLTEAEVDAFVGNNGYLTTEVDGSITNELQTISKTGPTVTLSNGGGSFTDEVNDADADATNEIQNLSQVLAQGADANATAITNVADPTNPQDAATKAYVDTEIAAIPAGGDLVSTNNLSDLTDAAAARTNLGLGTLATQNTITTAEITDITSAGSGAIITNAERTQIGTNQTNIATNTTNIAANATAIAADTDGDATNEIQDLSLAGTILNISGGTGVDLAPIIPPGGTDDQNLILTGDVLSIESGTGSVDLSTYVNDADADPNNEIQTLSQVLAQGADANATAITNVADPTNPQDAATKAYVDTEIAAIPAGGDLVSTNNLSDVADAAAARTNLGLGTIATQNTITTAEITDITSAGSGAIITNAERTQIGTNQTNIATNTTNIAANATAIAADTDSDATNEIQDLSLAGTILNISGGTGVDLAPIIPPGGTDDQNLILTGDVLSIESGTGSVDLSTYINDADADPANEIQNLSQVLAQGADANATAITNVADPTNPQDAATKAYVDTEIAAIPAGGDLVSTNNLSDVADAAAARTNLGLGTLATQNTITTTEITDITSVGSGAIITNAERTQIGTNQTNIATNTTNIAANATAIAADTDGDATNEIQTLSQVLAQGSDANATAITNVADPTNPQDAATKAYVDANVVALPSTTDAQILVSNGTTLAGTTMSGDVTINNTGVTIIADGAIVGGAAGKIQDGTIATQDLADGAITPIKIAPNGTTRSVLATTTAGTVTWVAPAGDNQLIGSNGTGDLVFRDATTAIVDGGTGIRDLATATNGVVATEKSVREAIDAVGTPTLQSAYSVASGNIIQLDGTNELTINTSSANPLLVTDDANGRIGIGTAAPFSKLDIVGGNVEIDQEYSFTAVDATDVFSYQAKNVPHYSLGWYGDTESAGLANAWMSGFSGIKMFTNGLPRMSVKQDGKVGIGTTTPLQLLDVQSTGVDDPALIRLANSDNTHAIELFAGRSTDPNPFINWRTGDPFRFTVAESDGSNFTEYMRIRDDGNLQISTALVLEDDDVSNEVTIQAPAVLPVNYTMTLPTDAGTNGFALITDGTGNLSWSNVGGTPTLQTAYNGGNTITIANSATPIGITATSGSGDIERFFTFAASDAAGGLAISNNSNINGEFAPSFFATTSGTRAWSFRMNGLNSPTQYFEFDASQAGATVSDFSTLMAVTNNGASRMNLTGAGNLLLYPTSPSGLTLQPFGAAAGNTSRLEFKELAANGLNYIGFKAPDNVATDLTFVLPATDGTNGQVLSTDGSGNLGWASAGNPNIFISAVNETVSIGSGSGTTGNFNTILGHLAGFNNAGAQSVLIGRGSGGVNAGSNNTFIGINAASSNSTGGLNTVIGSNAGAGTSSGVALTIGGGNTLLGANADVGTNSLTNATAIGANAIVNTSNAMVLGGIGLNAVNVGIGTTSPVSDFQIDDNAHFYNVSGFGTMVTNNIYNDAGTLRHTNAGTGSSLVLGDGSTGIYVNSNAAANASFGSSLANRFVITETGVSINKDGPDASAVLHLVSNVGAESRGFMMPSMPTTDRDQIVSPLDGLMIYNQTDHEFNYYNGNTTSWQAIGGGSSTLQAAYDGGSTINLSPNAFTINNAVGTSTYFNVSTSGGVGIGTSEEVPDYALYIDRQNNNSLINIRSGRADIDTEAGLRYLMSTGGIGTVYKTIARKTDGVAGGEQSDFIMQKEFSTAGGRIEFLKYENSSNNLILNAVNTTAGSYGNVVINGGNLGIGTNDPNITPNPNAVAGSKYVHLASLGTPFYILEKTDAPANTGKWGMAVDANGDFAIQDINGAQNALRLETGVVVDQLYLQAGGNVGIGTNNPIASLDVQSTGNLLINAEGNSPIGTWLNLYNNAAGGRQYGLITSADGNGEGGGLFMFYDHTAGFPRMSINSAGNVGIGTTTPNAKLEVVGDVAIPAANNYTYSSAKQKYLSIPSASFTLPHELPGSSTDGKLAGDGIGAYVYTYSLNVGFESRMLAPINLPDGAILNAVNLYMRDDDPSYTPTFVVRKVLLASAGSGVVTLGSAGVGAEGADVTVTVSGLSEVIDNSQYAYYILINAAWRNSAITRYYGARVDYTITQAD